MRRVLLVSITAFLIPTGAAFAQECSGNLDTLRETIEGEQGYSLLMRSGIRDEVSMLWRSASLLDEKGDEEVCNQVVLAIQSLVSKMAVSGSIIAPDAWYQQELERIATAQPVEQADLKLSTDEILGMSILTPRNEYIGDIDDVIFEDNQITYAVLERGGFLGMGEERIAVPWSRLSITEDGADFVLDLAPDELEAAPTFEEGQWREVATTEWREKNEAFFAE